MLNSLSWNPLEWANNLVVDAVVNSIYDSDEEETSATVSVERDSFASEAVTLFKKNVLNPLADLTDELASGLEDPFDIEDDFSVNTEIPTPVEVEISTTPEVVFEEKTPEEVLPTIEPFSENITIVETKSVKDRLIGKIIDVGVMILLDALNEWWVETVMSDLAQDAGTVLSNHIVELPFGGRVTINKRVNAPEINLPERAQGTNFDELRFGDTAKALYNLGVDLLIGGLNGWWEVAGRESVQEMLGDLVKNEIDTPLGKIRIVEN